MRSIIHVYGGAVSVAVAHIRFVRGSFALYGANVLDGIPSSPACAFLISLNCHLQYSL